MSARYLGGVIAQTQLPLNPAAGNAANGVFTMSQYMQAVKNATWPSYDPYFNETVLLLHGNGTNGAQNNTFLDSSTNNFTITRNGNTTQGTFSPFSVGAGEWSNFFDGNGDFLNIGAAANWKFLHDGSSWTIEFFVYHTSTAAQTVCGTTAGSAQIGFICGLNSFAANEVAIQFFRGSSPTGVTSFRSNAALTINKWNHVAITFDTSGKTCTFYIDGVQQGSSSDTGFAYSASNPSNTLRVGSFVFSSPSSGDFLIGYLSNLRISSTVRTGLTTVPTTPYTNDANTSLLTCQSNRFVDNSTNAFAITRNGDVRVTPFSPFAPTAAYSAGTNGGSFYGDGTGDYLSFTDSSNNLDLGGAVASVDMWVYPLGTGTYVIFAKHGGASNWNTTNGFEYQIQFTSGIFYFYYNNGGGLGGVTGVTDNVTRPANQWYHICVATDASNNIALFVNGSRVATGTNAIVKPTTRTTMFVGMDINGNALNGYLSGVNFIAGTGAYSATSTTLTIPTTPPTSITNTKLLLNFTNAGIIDNTGKNNLETVGNAQIDTTTKKFGTGSLEFDGTGDYIKGPTSDVFNFGTGNFTVEAWVYPTGSVAGGGPGIFDCRVTGNEAGGFILNLNASYQPVFYSSTTLLTGSTALSLNTWTHVALTRSGSTATLWVNGTSVGTVSNSTNFTTSNCFIGAAYTGVNNLFVGFIDDLRITKGVARYTSNFAVPYLPQGPLPLVGGPYIPNTVLMLPGTGTNGAQNNTFLDSSTNNFTITRNGNTTQGTFSPFSRANGYWGNYFDGTGDFLTTPYVTAFNLDSGDWTIEVWIYANVLSGSRGIYGSATTSETTGLVLRVNDNTVQFWTDGYGAASARVVTQTGTINANTWVHVALVKSSSTTTLYVNGTSVATSARGTSIGSPTNVTIGRSYSNADQEYFNGYISNLRVVKGTAVYTSNFTPTGPLTAIANTSLLTCQSNRFIDNSTNNFTITRNGDVRVVTFSPFEYLTAYSPATNGGSGYFDGTGDYLSVANDNVFDTNSTFTLECFIYLNSTANQQFFTRGGGVGSWSTSNGHQFLLFQESGTLYWMWNNAGNPVWISTTAPAISQWVHLAVGYNGTTTRFWVNGSSVGSSATEYTLPTTRNIIRIGESPAAGAPTNGFISSLRFVKGSDVYGVSNTSITVPTAPLTNITNTALLTNFTNAGIYDASMGNDLETVGNAQVSTTQSKWGGGSMYFDGTGDYLTTNTTNTLFDMQSGSFTIECWIYMTGRDSALRGIVTTRNSGSTANGFNFLVGTTNKLTFDIGNNATTNSCVGATSLALNTWYHVAAVLNGTSMKIYLNGIEDASATRSVGAATLLPLVVGRYWVDFNDHYFQGFMTDLRILKGVAILPTPLQTSQWQDQ